MRKIVTLAGLLLVLALLATLYAVQSEPANLVSAQEASFGAEYVGTEACAECHTEVAEAFMKSGHAYKLNPVVDGQPPEYPFTELPELPEGYTWDDISYVIGGYNWKARFMDQDGYIITDEPGKSGNEEYLNQYNFANPVVGNEAGWTTYHSGEEDLLYTCGRCHTTGYDPWGVHELPGVFGNWAEPGIRCEACHGPGSLHVANPRGVQMAVDRDSEQCGKCHIRGAPEAVNASGGFIRHHEQYEELFQSKHAVINCVQCHDPHVGVVQLRQAGEQTARTQCENCHFQSVKYQKSEVHPALGVACIDCHMPRVTKSAVGDAEKFTGDLRTHMMAIDPDQVGQFTEDGSEALSQLSLDFACRHCHVEGGTASPKTDEELIEKATGYHDRSQAVESKAVTQAPAPAPTPTPEAEAIEAEVTEVEAVTLSSGEVAYVGDPASITQEGGIEGMARQANLAFILDGSGSMNAELPGSGTTRLVVAKEVMSELVPQVPPEVNGALWIYGHRLPQDPKEESCQDIEQVFAMGPVDAAAYIQKISTVTALGYTPISDSIEQAARDLAAGDLNSIILVSDGEETCEGDPCALAEALKASDAGVTIHVVGYAVEEVAREQLECIARVSGGTYHDAEDAEGLLQALEEAMAATVAETILRVELMGADGTEMRDDVYLHEAGSDRLVSVYSTWKDNAVPPGSYDLLVTSQPPTVYQDLSIEEGSTTLVRIVLSAIRVLTPDGEDARFDLFDAATDERLGQLNGTVFLLPGIYKVSANDSISDPFTLEAGELEEVVLGAIRVLGPDGEEARFDLLDPDTDEWLSQETGIVFLLPGTYQVGANDSFSDPIKLDTGQTQEVLLGAISVLGPDGDGARFSLLDPATDDWLGQKTGSVLLLPGTYNVEVENGPTFENVVVEAGVVTEVK